MNPSQLEALVIQAVNRLRAGDNTEDDRVEFKRSWPDTAKARQLAGAANRAAGNDLVYIIGIDERSGDIHPTGEVDPAKWWAEMERAFDQTSPELVRHLNVHISEKDKVVALLFQTDRSPYVVKVQNGGATEREVPIRVGTRTRSAHRHELLRMLYPAISVPRLTGLDGSLRLGIPDALSSRHGQGVLELSMYLSLYFEHVGQTPAFLPVHAARVRLRGPRVAVESQPHYSSPANQSRTSGVLNRVDGIEVFSSGTSYIHAEWTLPERRFKAVSAVDEWKVELDFEVAGMGTKAALLVKFAGRSVRKRHASLPDEFTWTLTPMQLLGPTQ